MPQAQFRCVAGESADKTDTCFSKVGHAQKRAGLPTRHFFKLSSKAEVMLANPEASWINPPITSGGIT
jgi:hypothetical protein